MSETFYLLSLLNNAIVFSIKMHKIQNLYCMFHCLLILLLPFCFLSLEFMQDLSKLNRDPSRILYISGHALESSLQPENCVPINPWKLENDDTALLDLIPFLECKLCI